jgi:ribosomal protein S18 acetylase RimI-like enzyme
MLLIDALKRSFQNAQIIGSFALIVAPINKNAAAFYTKYDFITLTDSGKMFIAMKTLNPLLNN